MRKMDLILGAAVLSMMAGTALAGDAKEQARRAESRAAVMELGKRLKARLVQTLQAKGPQAAISVCNEAAPEIAADISKRRGWSVGRTALLLRNHTNAPDPWERETLKQFAARLAAGEDPKTLEAAETVSENGKREFRYMKAITLQKPCLTCHGPAVKAELYETILHYYPDDEAIGFKLGDLRGAFTVTQPLD